MAETVKLDDRVLRFARAQVQSGEYANVEDVVKAALRLLEEQASEDAAKLAELDRQIQEGLDDIEAGRTRPAEEVFDEIEARLKRRIADRGA